jgi:hypothetical protein
MNALWRWMPHRLIPTAATSTQDNGGDRSRTCNDGKPGSSRFIA